MNPTESGLFPYTWETVAGELTVRLYRQAGPGWRLVTDTTSDLAGLEFGGAEWVGWNQ